MQTHNLTPASDHDENGFHSQVLINEPGCRMMQVSLRAGQSISEDLAQSIVAIHPIFGHITLYADSGAYELYAGQSACIDKGLLRRIESREESSLFVSLCSWARVL